MANKSALSNLVPDKQPLNDQEQLKTSHASYSVVSEYDEERAMQQRGRQRLKYIAGICLIVVLAATIIGLGIGLTRDKGNGSAKSSKPPPTTTNMTELSIDDLQFLPTSRDDAKVVLRNLDTNEGKSTLQLLDDVDKITPDVVISFLDYFDSKADLSGKGVNVDFFKDQAYNVMLWLRSRPQLSGVMSLLRKWADNPELSPIDLAKAIDQVIGTFQVADFMQFLAWKPDKDGELNTTTLSNMISLSPEEFDEPGEEEGEFADDEDAPTNATTAANRRGLLAASSTRFQDPINQLATKQNPLGYLNNPRALGFKWFKPVKIGVVFHVLLYHDSRGFIYPYNANSQGDKPGRTLINVMNKAYKSANVQLYLKEWRSNPKKPGLAYLNIGKLAAWQQCAGDAEACTCNLAKMYSVNSRKYINVFIAGSDMLASAPDNMALAYSTIIPNALDSCREVMGWSVPTKTSQHLWMSWDMVDPDASNSPWAYEDGAMTLTHEMGHFMGLLHTHQGDCQNQDRVPDTPANKAIQDQKFNEALTSLCVKSWGKKLKLTADIKAKLRQFDSCKQQVFIDNVFNYMSYVHSACYQLFTKGQVRLMQKTLKSAHAGFMPRTTKRGL